MSCSWAPASRIEIPAVLDRLAAHEAGLAPPRRRWRPATARSNSTSTQPRSASACGRAAAADRGPLRRPAFLPIVSAATLAKALLRKSPDGIQGFVVEGPVAGGHNAPPRGQLQLDERGEPVYGDRDVVDLQQMQAFGVPFWLAGAYGSRERFQEALDAGAHGVQVGTAFAFCEESGLDPALRERFLAASSVATATCTRIRSRPRRASRSRWPS